MLRSNPIIENGVLGGQSMIVLEGAICYPATSNIAVNAVIRWLERNTSKYTGG